MIGLFVSLRFFFVMIGLFVSLIFVFFPFLKFLIVPLLCHVFLPRLFLLMPFFSSPHSTCAQVRPLRPTLFFPSPFKPSLRLVFPLQAFQVYQSHLFTFREFLWIHHALSSHVKAQLHAPQAHEAASYSSRESL